MRRALALPLHCTVGLVATLSSTFIGKRSALATYPDIMGCEDGCIVAASGWPLIFARDYLGMSVVNTANIMEVWFAADRFDWLPFWANVAFWTLLSVGAFAVSRSLWGHRRTS
ncbi:hypothetical protein [Brevundimonas sp. PAMC22021]|uniref:hypothetical protein n=1 Tax=Brevundimonas sp. PAMC22021 TaxID=2861285 RepID=UPI001C634A66|nr:hypothetical protein [Brevundimonas sp. PAMC22021]QYF86569.1 hypothetical protein KY493_12200 [Brevundimonas sp. PAMC22021]